MNMKSVLAMLAVAAISVVGTLSITSRQTPSLKADSHSTEENPQEAAAKGPNIPGLQLAAARMSEGWSVIKASGKVVLPPENLVKVGPQISGRVIKMSGTVGEAVRKGQTLAVISSIELAEARAAYRQARLRLQAAQSSLEREQRYVKSGDGSVKPVDDARLSLMASQGELSEAQSDLIAARTELSKAENELAQDRANLTRTKSLFDDQIVSRQDYEQAQREVAACELTVDAAKAKVSQVQSRIRKLTAEVGIQKDNLARQKTIYKSRTADLRTIQSVQADVAAASADAMAAKDRIKILGASPDGTGNTVSIVCPIDGRIVARQANVGEVVSPEIVMFEIADLSEVWIETAVYEKDLARIKIGQPVEAEVVSYPGRLFSGKIRSIGEILDPTSRTAAIRCSVRNDGGILRAGMLADASIVIAKRQGAVLIPKESVITEAGESYVYTPCMECDEDKKAGTNACGAYDKVVVSLGSTHGSQVEALSGLEPGTQVVSVGQYQLKSAYGSGQLKAGCADGH